MTTLTAQSAGRTNGSPTFSPPAAACVLGAPIENISEPPTGCPSAEITRQLSTCVPRCKLCGGVMVTVASWATTADGAIGSPSGPISRITSGATGSLNVKVSAAGASGTTAPSAGVALTSEACARACDASATTISSAVKKAATQARPRRLISTTYIFGNSLSAGAGSGKSPAEFPAAGISIQR